MTTQTQNKKVGGAKVPVLRFPEFSGAWEEKQLGGIGNLKNGYAFKSEKYTENGRFKVITIGNVKNGKLSTEKTSMINDIPKDIQDHQTLVVSDMLVSMTGNVGRVCLVDEENCLLNQRVGKIVLTDEQSDPAFIYQKLNTSEFEFRMQSLAQGGAQGNISKGDILSFKFFVPYFLEQQKIADFLGVVDEKIDGLSKKKKSLERYKKGVMQKIFSQEIRFKDESGNSYPDWEEKKLGEIGEIVSGGTPDTADVSLWNGKINWFTPTEIKQKYVSTSARNISAEGLRSSSAKLLPAGTLLLTTRATIGDVSILKCEATTNQGFQSILVNKENSNDFMYYWILKNKKEFLRRANGSTFAEISGKEVKKIKTAFPSLLEQKKIADFLTSLDEKISAIGNELSSAKEFKKGLLQQMFV